MRSFKPWLAAVLWFGCSGGNSGTVDSATTDTFAQVDAPPTFGARMPQVIAPDPTDILKAPKGMAISWDSDPNRASEEKFFTEYNISAWATQTSEYGVGMLSAATPAHIAGNAPGKITDAQVTAMIAANTTGTDPAWGSADPSTIYMFFIPPGTTVDDDGDLSCGGSAVGSAACATQDQQNNGDYDGYHYDTMVGDVDVPYAIVASCPCEALGLGISDLDDMMITAGHETLEASTDPFTSGSDLGWGEIDDAHSAFEAVTEGEIADMCEFASSQDWVSPPSMDFSIQRTWSNKIAAAGHDPCVGDAMATYYQTIPADPDLGVVNYEGFDQNTAGTKIGVGSSGTIELQVYTDSATGPFNVYVYDYDGTYDDNGSDTDPVLDIAQPTGTFMPGDKISLQVTVKQTDPDGITGGELYEIDTDPVSDTDQTQYTSWYAWVLQ